MSEETLKYQRELIRDAKNVIGQVEITEPMSETNFANLILVISQLEDIRDIAVTTNDNEKAAIMDKWL